MAKKTKKPIIATVIGGTLNVRATAEKGNNITGELQNGQQIELLETGDTWCRFSGGYVMTEFLQIETKTTTPEVDDHENVE